MTEETIFACALEKSTPADRTAYLDEACADDAALRKRVEALLESHFDVGGFLLTPAIERAAEEVFGQRCSEDTQGKPPGDDDDATSLAFLGPSEKSGSLGRLGHYEVSEVIGRGGMGVVLRALDEKLQRVVAIKVMAPLLAASANARQRFIREAQAAAAVRNDHVVNIYAVEEINGLPYLVMECISGVSLQERLDRDGPLDVKEILRIGMQTAAGLAAAHAQGLIHRDIKPANILLENGVERVKITDFGLARAVDDVRFTQTGIVAGTPQYMAPEQARGDAVDHRADLFSLGSVLYAMCTGRPPFRASTTMGILRRVSDDIARPIRELNADIPDWLVAIIDKLHAKNPAERFQSAAEVAELLSRYLAEVQHPSIAPAGIALHAGPRMGRHPTEGALYNGRRRWAVAAAVLLCLGVTLGLAEATGTTQLTATVIRIFTPSGTLVVETDDSSVNVTIEGDGGLVITGAGPQEVRVRPGSYQVKAMKKGKPVKLDRNLVSITRGDKQVVRVRLEEESQLAAPATVERGAFVLLENQAIAERKFDTLADAVLSASDGDTIEVRGNGPFVSQPINIGNRALTIRAGDGSRPVIKLSAEAVQRDLPLLATNAALVLEGLELQRVPQEGGRVNRVLEANEAAVRAANCRFRSAIWTHYSPGCVFRNCEFLSDVKGEFNGHYSPGARFSFENCLYRTAGAALYLSSVGNASEVMSIQIKRSTFVSRPASLWLALRSPLAVASDRPQSSKPIRLEVSESIFDGTSVVGFEQTRELLDKAALLPPAEAEAQLLRLVAWPGERNVYAAGSTSVYWAADGEKQPPRGPKRLEEWKRFWRAVDADSQEGHARFQGGNLLSRSEADLEQLTPDDFRLRPDSAGYRAGPDGKDLGADVDLVGPGPAYERWKKSPEYQEWLKDTGQSKESGDTTQESDNERSN